MQTTFALFNDREIDCGAVITRVITSKEIFKHLSERLRMTLQLFSGSPVIYISMHLLTYRQPFFIVVLYPLLTLKLFLSSIIYMSHIFCMLAVVVNMECTRSFRVSYVTISYIIIYWNFWKHILVNPRLQSLQGSILSKDLCHYWILKLLCRYAK